MSKIIFKLKISLFGFSMNEKSIPLSKFEDLIAVL